ncbi:MAG: hypothetical protein H7099_11295, partial [Gemmatimonadaceae bacterium]|nr:hypothetical protein [Gemmatimonadaceae bacterium]
MLRVHTLDGCRVSRDGVRLDTFSAQQKALALLALLAAEPAGVSRAVVLAYLWPESDEERARTTLRQLVRGLRAGLAAPDLVEGTAVLRLGAGAATSDIADFRAALACGDDEQAVTWHSAPFLDGFHVRGTDEFERWVDTTRASIAGERIGALTRLAYRASARGDHAGAVDWWRRIAAANPVGSAPALGLMRALDAAGDRPAALQHARVHTALVQQELCAEPDAAVSALVDALRSRHRVLVADVAAADCRPEGPGTTKADDLEAAVEPPTKASTRSLPSSGSRTRSMLFGSAALLGAAAVAVAVIRPDEVPHVTQPSTSLASVAAGDAAERQHARSRTDSATESLYRRGRHAFNNRIDGDGIRQAVRYFEAAVTRDPAYAPAHAGLSDAYTRLAVFGHADPPTVLRQAKDEALRAVALDSALAEGRISLAHVLFVGEYAWDAAEYEFRRALALDPGYAFGRAPFAILLMARGQYHEALVQLDTAGAAEPLAPWVANVRGRVLVAAGRPQEAVRVLEETLALHPAVDFAYQQLGHAYLALHQPARAIAAFRRGAATNGARDSAHLAYAYG